MPGSPYLEEPPKGLMTWPRLLKMTLPFALIGLVGAVYLDAVFEGACGVHRRIVHRRASLVVESHRYP